MSDCENPLCMRPAPCATCSETRLRADLAQAQERIAELEAELAAARIEVARADSLCHGHTESLGAAEATLAKVREQLALLDEDIARRREELSNKGGMRVPNHGRFCSAVPSVVRDLEHFARDVRALLDGREG